VLSLLPLVAAAAATTTTTTDAAAAATNKLLFNATSKMCYFIVLQNMTE
jgi:hypothetical protein